MVGGYDERILSYGQDDTNLKDRMCLAGLTKKVFNYDTIEHQHHEQAVRAQGSHGIHPMVATFANRLMTTYAPLWSSTSERAQFVHLDQGYGARYICFKLICQPEGLTNNSNISEALRIVGSWYIEAKLLEEMGDDDINSVIWAKQLE